MRHIRGERRPRLPQFRPLLVCVAAVLAVSCATPAAGPTQPGGAAGGSGGQAGGVASGSSTSIGSAGPENPAGTPTNPDACPARALAAMTEEQRVGQLFLLGIDGDRLSAAETAALKTYHLGSAWLVNWRTGGLPAVRPLTLEIQALATTSNTGGVGFFVAADQEGGRIQRVTGPGFTTIPSALEQGQLPVTVLQADAAEWGRELAAAGVNLDLAPVMDVVPPGSDAANAPIGALQREFGHDPDTVGGHGAAVVEGMAQAGIATTLKHFPGLGRVAGNTDTAAGVVDSATTTEDPFLGAFRAGIQAGAPFVMISLARYSAIDPDHQAVFSPAIMGGLLRDQLGFGGVVMSDDLGAAASVASLAPGDRAVAFIQAGGDFIVAAGTGAAGQMATAVLDRARANPVFAARVDGAALRVLRAKGAYGLLRCG